MDSIANELQSLPLEQIIAAPMQGAIKASGLAAQSTLEFISKVGFTGEDSTRKINTTSFMFNDTKIQVPLLSMIPIPYIRIKTLKVDFDFKINTTEIEKKSTDKELSLEAKMGFSVVSATLKGSYKSAKEKSTQNDESAKLHVELEAVQDEIPAGLKKLLNIFEDSIKYTPLPTSTQIPEVREIEVGETKVRETEVESTEGESTEDESTEDESTKIENFE